MIILVILSLSFLGCATPSPEHRLGHFTAASSYNVRNLDYDDRTAVPVMGEDCFEIGAQPNDSRLQRAMDSAIRNGQKRGVKGDLLVNVRIDEYTKHVPIFLGLTKPHNCIRVKGDLVTIQ